MEENKEQLDKKEKKQGMLGKILKEIAEFDQGAV